jgi:hypothetical protein
MGEYAFTPNQTFVLYPQLANATTLATPKANPPPSQQAGAAVSAAVPTYPYSLMNTTASTCSLI